MIKRVSVYCSSSNKIDGIFRELARDLGERMGRAGLTLVYGGGKVGLMGVIARAVHAEGGEVFGVIPNTLKAREGVATEVADELIVTDSMRERKAMMYFRGEAYVVLPGGYGTLEEFFEVLTLKQLHYHAKPIILLNVNDFFTPLIEYLDSLRDQHFVGGNALDLFTVVDTVEEVMAVLATRSTATG